MRTTSTLLRTVALAMWAAACPHDPPAGPAPARVRAVMSADREGNDREVSDDGGFSYAVIGDMPYGQAKLDSFPMLISLINSDRAVQRVIHVGDIKAGSSSPCTDVYFATISGLFGTFQDPLVYTPGDNEWTDCHAASKNNGLFTPTERLQAVRKLFFPVPGRTLGVHQRSVTTQADDPANSQYVENVSWLQGDVVFAAVNITGSFNDLASWGTPLPADAANYPTQAQEFATRAQANTAWINRAFDIARRQHARGVVLAFQADMWDPAEQVKNPTLFGNGYDGLVQQIGTLAAQFGKPVLLLEGDSHVWRTDKPFTPGDPFFGIHPNTPVATNVTRLVVDGSSSPTSYTRLTIGGDDEGHRPLFTLTRVPLVPGQ
jgi:hypothetical protein